MAHLHRHPAGIVLVCLLLSGGAMLDIGTARAGAPDAPAAQVKPEERTPEEKMQRRYPQPIRVGDLIGLPLLDYDDRTLGNVRSIVRDAAGKIKLITAYGGSLPFRRRLVAVPIEVVAIAGRQLALLDLTPQEVANFPTWNDPAEKPIDQNEMIRIALYKR